MNEAEQNTRWAAIIAESIENNLQRYFERDRDNMSFVGDMAAQDEAAYDPRNIKEASLSAAWNFADSFFDAAWHGFRDVDHIPWDEAVKLLQDVVVKLRTGQPITDARVLHYAR